MQALLRSYVPEICLDNSFETDKTEAIYSVGNFEVCTESQELVVSAISVSLGYLHAKVLLYEGCGTL